MGDEDESFEVPCAPGLSDASSISDGGPANDDVPAFGGPSDASFLFSAADAEAAAGEDGKTLENPDLIDRLAYEFGSQCVVLGVDSRMIEGEWRVHQYTGDPDKTRTDERRTLDWVAEGIDRGAGEVVLNCMDMDGVRDGYDTEQLAAVRAICSTPLIASGGAGRKDHFKSVFETAKVDGALAASVFHKGVMEIGDLKAYLAAEGIRVRP